MLTEAKTYNDPDATTIAPAARPLTSRCLRDYLSRPAQFLAIVVQFALIAVIVGQWQLESQLLSRLMWLAFFGFIVHHLLPRRFRLPFFAMLSLVGIIMSIGHLGPNVGMAWLNGKITTSSLFYYVVPGLTLIAFGLGWIGICHLHI